MLYDSFRDLFFIENFKDTSNFFPELWELSEDFFFIFIFVKLFTKTRL